MSAKMHRVLPAVAVMSCGALALAAEPTTAELKAQIDALQKKVEALEAKQVNAADVDATVRQVLQDSERRSQLMDAEGFTAGYSKGKFVIQSADGNFLWHPYLQWQVRNASNYREDAKSTGGDEFENGFEIRRMKMGFEGNVFSPDLTYQFQWATDRTNGTPGMEDAWAKYRFTPSWALQAGQFKDPLFRESLVSATKQLTADRSLLNNIIENNDNYIEGVSLIYNQDRLRVQSAFTNGFGSQNSTFIQPSGDPSDADYAAAGNRKFDMGLSARAEYMVLGDPATGWNDYTQFSAMGVKQDLLILGTAGEWDPVGDANYYWYTADAQWIPAAVRGLSLYGALVGRQAEVGTPDESFSDWGGLAQAGYMVNERLEPFVRYDYTRVGPDLLSDIRADAYGTRNVHEITAGFNYYVHGHSAKFTVDLSYLPNGSPVSATGGDVLAQPSEADQWIARAQFQLML